MAIYKRLNIELPEGKKLIALRGIQFDLRFCLDACGLYRNVLKNDNGLIPQCVAQAIIVRYVRCFNSGKRKEGNEDLRNLFTPEENELHQFFFDLRNRHFGHSVSELEMAQLTVLLNPEEEGRKIHSIGVISSFINAPSLEDFGKLEKLLEKLIQHLDVMAIAEQVRLMPLVEKRYPVDKIYEHKGKSFDWAPAMDPDQTKAALGRNRTP